MSASAIIFLRHGRTAYNAEGRLQGQVDIPLDEVGRWQAAMSAVELAARVRTGLREGGRIRIVSSDLMRAAATAEALGRELGASVETDERLREQAFGEWEGLTRDEIKERWPEEAAAWLSGGVRGGEGSESRTQVGDRVAEITGEVVDAARRQDAVILVSHGAAITAGITTLLGLNPEEWRGIQGLDNAYWSVMTRGLSGHSRSGRWRLAAHNHGPDVPPARWRTGPASD